MKKVVVGVALAMSCLFGADWDITKEYSCKEKSMNESVTVKFISGELLMFGDRIYHHTGSEYDVYKSTTEDDVIYIGLMAKNLEMNMFTRSGYDFMFSCTQVRKKK